MAVAGYPSASASDTFTKHSEMGAREKQEVIKWYHANGKNQTATSDHFEALPGYEKLNQSTVSHWVADDAQIRELVAETKRVCHPEFENFLMAWLDGMDASNSDTSQLIAGERIKRTAVKVYDRLQIPVEERQVGCARSRPGTEWRWASVAVWRPPSRHGLMLDSQHERSRYRLKQWCERQHHHHSRLLAQRVALRSLSPTV